MTKQRGTGDKQPPPGSGSSCRPGIAVVPRLQWIVTTPTHDLDKQDRRRIKANATRSRVKQQTASAVRSWISPGQEINRPKPSCVARDVSIPLRAGTDFSGLQLPSGIEPYMIQELVKMFEISKLTAYPYEICVNVPPVERGWFPYMLSDVCCLHSLMFSIRVWEDRATQSHISRAACFHYAQTLQMLQERLIDRDQASAVSDATIMVVVMLATVAELTNEHSTLESHIRGLERIVKLRGGVRALTTHTNMPVKVCRADLSFALSTGNPPFLFKDDISWDCFIAGHGNRRCSHTISHSQDPTLTSMDSRLLNVFKDVHALACLSNLAHQTGRKLSPEMYNEIMISVLYRLVRLSFAKDDTQEAFRLGLLCFCSTTFMHRQNMEQPYTHLFSSFRSSLDIIYKKPCKPLADPFIFWLLIILATIPGSQCHLSSRWHDIWLAEVIALGNVDSWTQAKERLRSVAWVGFIHDKSGERAFVKARETSTRH